MKACKVNKTYCEEHCCVHGGEAEELRDGIEKIIANETSSIKMIYDDKLVEWGDVQDALQRLLDRTDARDSLAFLEAKDRKRKKGSKL